MPKPSNMAKKLFEKRELRDPFTKGERKYYENFRELRVIRRETCNGLCWWPRNLFMPPKLFPGPPYRQASNSGESSSGREPTGSIPTGRDDESEWAPSSDSSSSSNSLDEVDGDGDGASTDPSHSGRGGAILAAANQSSSQAGPSGSRGKKDRVRKRKKRQRKARTEGDAEKEEGEERVLYPSIPGLDLPKPGERREGEIDREGGWGNG